MFKKNVLFSVQPDPSLEFWMSTAEQAIKDPLGVKTLGEQDDLIGNHQENYWKVAKMLKTLFTNKFQPDTEGYMIAKRQDNGLIGYAEIHRYYTEISGLGLREITNKLMNPKCASNEEEVVR